MSQGRRTVGLVVGTLGVGAAIGVAAWTMRGRADRPVGGPQKPAVVQAVDEGSGPVAKALRRGDAEALDRLQKQLADKPEGRPKALDQGEAAEWVDVLTGLRAGFGKFAPQARPTAIVAATAILDKFAVEPAPDAWIKAMEPVHNVLTLGMADPDPEVRTAALMEVARLWSWLPGVDLYQSGADDARELVTRWKEGFYEPAVRNLAQPKADEVETTAQARCRAAAVQCLGGLPVDDKAAPALALVSDRDPNVRLNVLSAFASRPTLLTEEAMLPLLHDPFREIANLTAKVLEGRGLSGEQIGLCRLIGHPRPDMRASAIPLLLSRTDIDPILWLLFLTRDADASVRLKAVEALAGRVTIETQPRLEEMAASDPSPAVRAAAVKLLPKRASTAALPPLPGSPSLTPKAN
jgi:HEAT repeat protein